jgi:hypothetical protein
MFGSREEVSGRMCGCDERKRGMYSGNDCMYYKRSDYTHR